MEVVWLVTVFFWVFPEAATFVGLCLGLVAMFFVAGLLVHIGG